VRIAWLTPLTFGSGVSRFSLSVVRALNSLEGIDVDVWHSPSENDVDCPWAPTFSLADLGAKGLDGYDTVIFNLGNHPGNHAAIYECYRRTRGIVVLHDRVMQDFFFSYASESRKNPMLYACLMGYVYGAEAAQLAIDIVLQGQTAALWEEASARFPLFEPCLFNASGVVTHSYEAYAKVNSRYPGLLPSVQLEHPYYLYALASDSKPPLSRVDLAIPDDKVLVVASGRISPQKRIDVVMSALATDPELKARALLVIAGGGDADCIEHLRSLSRELGLEDTTRFVVDPDDRTMQSLVSLADVAVNLRHPSTESASGSLIEQIYFRKPVIVSKIGVYDELPDDVVVKVSLEDEKAELGKALRRLVLDTTFRENTVVSVRTYAESHFSSKTYAERLVAFAADPRICTDILSRADARAAQLRGGRLESMRSAVAEAAAELMAGGADEA